MATFDAHSNFGYSTVLLAPAPALSGTSLTVQPGQGALFPAAPFNCTVWPAGVPYPLASNAEIVRVTAVVGDVLTITRAQEGTAAIAIADGFQIANTASKKVFTDLESAVNAAGTVTSVGMTVPSFLSVAGSPITSSGILALSLVNQNANLIFGGPSSGGAAAPTFRSLVEADTTLSDVTTNNVSTTKHGYAPKLPNDATKYLDGTGAYSVPAGSGGSGIGWTAVITKSADQTVTNSGVLVNDSELLYALEANSYYLFEFVLLYSGNDGTGDYQGGFTYPDVTGSMNPIFHITHFTTGLVNQIVSGIGDLTAMPSGGSNTWPLGTFPTLLTSMMLRFQLRTFATTGNLQWRFCNNVPGVGRDSTTRAGSTLFVKKMA